MTLITQASSVTLNILLTNYGELFMMKFSFIDTFNGSQFPARDIVGWIHSHVRNDQDEPCFFTSHDVHIQYSLQSKTSNFFGIVMQINSKGKYEDHEFYKLTEKGMTTVKKCLADSNIEHIQQEHSSCKSKNLYASISDEAELLPDMSLIIQHCN